MKRAARHGQVGNNQKWVASYDEVDETWNQARGRRAVEDPAVKKIHNSVDAFKGTSVVTSVSRVKTDKDIEAAK